MRVQLTTHFANKSAAIILRYIHYTVLVVDRGFCLDVAVMYVMDI